MNTPLLLKSLGVAGGAWLVALVAGWAAAVAVAAAGPRGRQCGWMLAIVTLAMPPFLPANCWLDLTAAWRTAVGPEKSAFGMVLLTSLVLGLGLWPLTFFLVTGAWQRVQPGLLETEPALAGAGIFRWVLFPAAKRALALAGVITLALALANFTVPVLFQVRVLTEEFWVRYNTQFDLRGALGATWLLWLLPLAVGAWGWRREVVWPRDTSSLSPGLLRARLGTWVIAARVVILVVAVVSLLVPMGRLLFNGRTWTELPSALAAAQLATVNSLWAAATTACLVTGAATGFSRWLGGRGSVPKLVRGFGWMLFLLPGVFLAVALIGLLNRPGLAEFYGSFGVVLLALGLRYFALALGGVTSAWRATDRSLDETAVLTGARRGSWNYFQLVTWPQSGGLLVAVAYAVYLLCLWDVESIVLLQPPGGETLALRIFNLLHYGHAAQVNALCVVVLGLALLPLAGAGAWRWLRRAQRTSPISMVAGLLISAGLLSGCGASADTAAGNRHALESKLFSAVEILGSRGVAPGQFNKPRSMVCDREDNLYVTDMTGRVQKFSPDGRFLLQWQLPQTDLGKPKGMALDPAGNIVVVEPHYQRVNHFATDGRLLGQWGRRGTNVGEFILPRCVAVNSAGEYYLGEYTSVERVQRFALGFDVATLKPGAPLTNAPFTLLGSWGRPGQAAGELNRAEGATIGPGDTLYVADSCNHRIQLFDRTGRWLRSHGEAGATAGRLSYPYDVRVEADGRQFICEFGNSRITVLDARDQLLEVVGRAGPRPGEFANPWAICLDSHGNLYVADSQNHRVQKLLRRPGPTVARRN